MYLIKFKYFKHLSVGVIYDWKVMSLYLKFNEASFEKLIYMVVS